MYHTHWWPFFHRQKQKYEIVECQRSTVFIKKTTYQIMTEVMSV